MTHKLIRPFYSRPLDYGTIDPNFVDYLNVPFGVASFSPLQLIDRFANQVVKKSLSSLYHFLVPSTAFLALMTVGCLLYWLSSELFLRLEKSSRPSGKRLRLKTLSFFYLLFLFYIQQFFGANLNTMSVVVSTLELLYSNDQILRTQKEFCALEQGAELDFYKNVSFLLIEYIRCRMMFIDLDLDPNFRFPLSKLSFRHRSTRYYTKYSRNSTNRTPASCLSEIKWATCSRRTTFLLFSRTYSWTFCRESFRHFSEKTHIWNPI